MLLASELYDLLRQRYPDKAPLVEVLPFRQGEMAGVQKLLKEMEVEIHNGKNKRQS